MGPWGRPAPNAPHSLTLRSTMSAICTASRAAAAPAAALRAQAGPSALLAPLRPCSSAACFRQAALAPQRRQQLGGGRRQAAALPPRAEGGSGSGEREIKVRTAEGWRAA